MDCAALCKGARHAYDNEFDGLFRRMSRSEVLFSKEIRRFWRSIPFGVEPDLASCSKLQHLADLLL
jgi:hypothetical protein